MCGLIVCMGKVWLKTIDLFEKITQILKSTESMFLLARILKNFIRNKKKSLPEVITCDTQDIPHLQKLELFDLPSLLMIGVNGMMFSQDLKVLLPGKISPMLCSLVQTP